jgi:hypothetical protein
VTTSGRLDGEEGEEEDRTAAGSSVGLDELAVEVVRRGRVADAAHVVVVLTDLVDGGGGQVARQESRRVGSASTDDASVLAERINVST